MSMYLRFECDVCGHGASRKIEDSDTANYYPPQTWMEVNGKHLCSGKCYDKMMSRINPGNSGWKFDPRMEEK